MRYPALLAVGLSTAAAGQSPAALEAVRLRRTNALTLVKAELDACRGPSACPRLRELSLLGGVLALSEGDPSQARTTLAQTPPPPGLDAFHAYYLAQSDFYTRAYAQAAQGFQRAQKGSPPWLVRDAQAREAEAYLAAQQPAKAGPLLEAVLKERPTPELYFQRAAARRDLKNRDGQVADLRAIAIQYPAHAYATLALAQLTLLKPEALKFTFEERLTRARGLLESDPEASLTELALAETEKLARTPPSRARLALQRAQAFYAKGLPAEAGAQVDLARQGPASIAAEATMLRAKALLRANDHPGAKAAYAEVDQRWQKEPPADDAAYLVGWLHLQDGLFPDAIAAFVAFDQRHNRSRKRDEALWYRALAEVRLSRFADARSTLQSLLARFPRTQLVPQALYWGARCAQLQGSSADAAKAYRDLIPLFPGSFYAALAAERLREMNEVPPPGFPSAPQELKAALPPELKLARALNDAGLFRDASEEVSWQISHVRTAEQALLFGSALASLGEHGAAHALAARQLWGAAYTAKEGQALALFYPRAFQSSVEGSAKQEALDPFFLWAIMRRESAYRTEVQSGANARGLMQLIPPTAVAIAKALALPSPNPDELFSPELNIKMGAWYLAKLLERFGHPALVAAAYNAGPQAAVKWLKENGALPLDLFVETIPFKETRGYVKQVVADYLTYHALYEGSAPRLALSLPPPSDAGVNF